MAVFGHWFEVGGNKKEVVSDGLFSGLLEEGGEVWAMRRKVERKKIEFNL